METSGDRVSGGEFQRRREALGLKVADLASFARVTKGTISSYESGTRQPRAEQYWSMLEVLGRLEAGKLVTLVARRATARSGEVIVARMISDDLEEMNRALDEIARKDG